MRCIWKSDSLCQIGPYSSRMRVSIIQGGRKHSKMHLPWKSRFARPWSCTLSMRMIFMTPDPFRAHPDPLGKRNRRQQDLPALKPASLQTFPPCQHQHAPLSWPLNRMLQRLLKPRQQRPLMPKRLPLLLVPHPKWVPTQAS